MKNLQEYQNYTVAELTEALEEAKRALKILKSNEDLDLRSETKFYLGQSEILTIVQDSNVGFLAAELTESVQLLEEELKKRKR